MGHGCPRFYQICINRALSLTKGHNSKNNQRILSVIELDLYFMITYLCMKMNPIHQRIQKISPGIHYHMEIKGHNSNNNWLILSVIELDLYFMITYLCMKYESNTPTYSKAIARKPFFIQRSRAITLIIIG